MTRTPVSWSEYRKSIDYVCNNALSFEEGFGPLPLSLFSPGQISTQCTFVFHITYMQSNGTTYWMQKVCINGTRRNVHATCALTMSIFCCGRAGVKMISDSNPMTSSTSSFRHSNPAWHFLSLCTCTQTLCDLRHSSSEKSGQNHN